MDQAVALCRVLWREGVTAAIATPHQLGRYALDNNAARVREATVALQQKLNERRIGLTLYPGGEVRLDDRVSRLIEEASVNTLADRGTHVLIELPPELVIEPDALLPRMATSLGPLKVVLAHVERYGCFRNDSAAARRWFDAGAILQVNTGSLLGIFGEAEQTCAWNLLSQGVATIVASDAHNLTNRPPRWGDAMRRITARLGAPFAHRVCFENPAAILHGLPSA